MTSLHVHLETTNTDHCNEVFDVPNVKIMIAGKCGNFGIHVCIINLFVWIYQPVALFKFENSSRESKITLMSRYSVSPKKSDF